MSDETQAAAELWSNVQVVVDQGRRNNLSSRQIAEQLLATFKMELHPEPPTCKFCGADCSEGRNWNGGDDYECPRCAEGKLELRAILETPAWNADSRVTALLSAGWRRSKGTQLDLALDIEAEPGSDLTPESLAPWLWEKGWRR